MREALTNQQNQMAHPLNRLSGLRGNSKAGAFLESQQVLFTRHDVELREILRQTTNLHVVLLADDDGMKSIPHKPGHGLMRHTHQRAGRFNYSEAALAHGAHPLPGSAVGGDHHGLRGHIPGVVLNLNAAGTQFGKDGLVVNQITENRQRPVLRGLAGQGNGIAHAKAHAQMFCAEDFHIELCITK